MAKPASSDKSGHKKPTAIRLHEGTRIRVIWPRDNRWHAGYVKKYDAKKALHTVVSDHGDSKRLDLRTTQWEFEDPTADPAKFLRPRGTRGRKKASVAGAAGATASALPQLFPVGSGRYASSNADASSDSGDSSDPSFGGHVDSRHRPAGGASPADSYEEGEFVHRGLRARRSRRYVASDDESADGDNMADDGDDDTDAEESDYHEGEDVGSDSECDYIGGAAAAESVGRKRRLSDEHASGVDSEGVKRSRKEGSFFTLTEVAWQQQQSQPPSHLSQASQKDVKAKRPVGRPRKVKCGMAQSAEPIAEDDVFMDELMLIMAVARRLVKDKCVSSATCDSLKPSPVSGAEELETKAGRRTCSNGSSFALVACSDASGEACGEGGMVEVKVVQQGEMKIKGEVQRSAVKVDVQRHMEEDSIKDLRAVHVLPVTSSSSAASALYGSSAAGGFRFMSGLESCSRATWPCSQRSVVVRSASAVVPAPGGAIRA